MREIRLSGLTRGRESLPPYSTGQVNNGTRTISNFDNPLRPFLDHQGFLVLDGGFATELEARGCDINDPLWSGKVLLEDPDLIRSVHYDYLVAGADCIASASYQATIEGFERRGLSRSDAAETIRASVQLAIEARDHFWNDPANHEGRLRPLVAASIGPYGAFLADGSEYDGRYGLSREELVDFHRARWQLLAESGPDLFACETIPSLVETHAIVDLLRETPTLASTIGFSCRDGEHLHDGSHLRDAIHAVSDSEQIVAIGVNCVPPSLVSELIATVKQDSDKPIIVYPNSGEKWNATTKTWFGVADPGDFGDAAGEWYGLGARVIGGCCRTGPKHVSAIRDALLAAEERG
jgi:homocysteine S-methyltransferase